ncbi:MAG: amino acid adenylation domain-containing protein, partial [Thermoanaerobaculia bacterium]
LLSPLQLDELFADDADYWLRNLQGDLPFAGIPLDFERPSGWSDEVERTSFELSRETSSRLLEICNRRPALIFSALVAALKVCLKRYSGSEDVLVGTAIHKQNHGRESLNRVVVLRDRLREKMTGKDLLLGVKQTLSRAFSHQKYPFDRLIERLDLSFPANRNPLFAVLVRLADLQALEDLGGLRHDVGLDLALNDGTVSGTVSYRPYLHRPETLKTFTRHFGCTVAALVHEPSIHLVDLDLLAPPRRHQLVTEFNSQPAPGAGHSRVPAETVLDRFSRRAAEAPLATAMEFGQETWSYRKLDAESNRLAHYLVLRGVTPGVKVGVCLEHSPQLVVALLGVIKAGGSFVAMDPKHPAARRRFIAADSDMALLVTTRALAEDPAEEGPQQVHLDAEAATLARQSSEPAESRVAPDHLAYVLYTSGSTGRSKGVAITHGSLMGYLRWAEEAYLRGEEMSCGLYTSVAFDLTITSLFLPLVSGNRLIVYGEATRNFAKILTDGRVGLLKLTPSHLSLLSDRDLAGARLQRLVVGGEAFSTALARRLQRALLSQTVEIYNEYGPTEATVACMIHRFDSTGDVRPTVPIGVPAAGARIYVLDSRLRPVAENVAGEIYVGGPGLAIGYLDRPALTAERFVPDPFEPDSRLYRTGDLARHLPGGGIEFLGRNDDQVKYHGHRIELGEIRLALNRHPKVRDSAVVLGREAGGDEVLVAYYAS